MLMIFPPTHPARQFKAFWNDLSVLDDVLLVLTDSRIVVPKSYRPQLLKNYTTPILVLLKLNKWLGICTTAPECLEKFKKLLVYTTNARS